MSRNTSKSVSYIKKTCEADLYLGFRAKNTDGAVYLRELFYLLMFFTIYMHLYYMNVQKKNNYRTIKHNLFVNTRLDTICVNADFSIILKKL